MASTDLYIIAAGIGSRINLDIPKALVPIADEPCLTTTLQRIGPQFNRVFIVTNILAAHHWRSYFQILQVTQRDIARRVINLPIQSGLGDGHATLQALQMTEERGEISDEVIVTWGDAFFSHGEIIDELLSARKRGSGLLPAVWNAIPMSPCWSTNACNVSLQTFPSTARSTRAGFTINPFSASIDPACALR